MGASDRLSGTGIDLIKTRGSPGAGGRLLPHLGRCDGEKEEAKHFSNYLLLKQFLLSLKVTYYIVGRDHTRASSPLPLLTLLILLRMTGGGSTSEIDGGTLHPVFSHSSQRSISRSRLAEESIARDLEEDPEVPNDAHDDWHKSDTGSESSVFGPEDCNIFSHSMAASYRKPSFTMPGARSLVLGGISGADRGPTRTERLEARREERSLLRDNNVIPPKHPQNRDHLSIPDIPGISGIPGGDRTVVAASEEEAAANAVPDGIYAPSESTPLLGDPTLPYGGHDYPESLNKKWEEAVASGIIKTTWQREAKVVGRYTAPLMVTTVLQYSLTLASIFTLGHLGKVELGAVSLASMTASITGFAVYQGLATSLDTLCAQAYGSGNKKLVGLQMQRMVYFLWLVTIPIGIIWLCADKILLRIVPEKDVAVLAGLYLRVILAGTPGYTLFESGKRYVQAQGLFSASLYVLLVCCPLNAFLNWLFVWQFNWGFVGAPIAVALTENLLPIGLFLYVRFFAGSDCWPGLTKRAFHNWGPMIKLALPGLLMVEAECLAFEIITLGSSYFGTTVLAAQTVLSTACSITWQLPFPLSIATSTRVANLIGASLSGAAKTTARVGLTLAFCVGLLNFVILSTLRNFIPRLFTNDQDVQAVVAKILPLCAAFQLFDALAANCNGILRGLGRQIVGGYVQLFCYYVVAIPISFGVGFGLDWQLYGMWTGVAIALGL